MINRVYFFTAESLPTLRKQRRADGKITLAGGFVHYRSFFADPEFVSKYALANIVNVEKDFIEGEIILTHFARV